MDWLVILLPYQIAFTISVTLLGLFFLIWPIKLIWPKLHLKYIFGMFLLLTAFAYLSKPLSGMATRDPNHSHCGKATYTGFFYFLHPYLNSAHQDDLEARNQLCWVRKIITRVPQDLSSPEEVEAYLKITKDKLLRPEIKYRVALPPVLYLWGNVLVSLDRFNGGKKFIEGLGMWSDLYSTEISEREYQWYEWPHSSLIQAEYGFVEKNWNNIKFEFKFFEN